MSITYYRDLIQGSDEWLAARCGLLTASEMKLIITPTLKIAANDKTRTHMFELLAQRITGHVEPTYIGDDMLRGMGDEIIARGLYAERYAPVDEVGFITRDFGTFKIGYSPDGLVCDDGTIEAKSRRQKYQAHTICSWEVPEEYKIQIQTGLMVTGRAWCDFISYSGGMPMATIRVNADPDTQHAIMLAAASFEAKVAELHSSYLANTSNPQCRTIPTERTVEQEMI